MPFRHYNSMSQEVKVLRESNKEVVLAVKTDIFRCVLVAIYGSNDMKNELFCPNSMILLGC